MTPVLLFASGYLLRAEWVLRTEDLSEQQASRTLIRGVQLSRQARSACRPCAGRAAGAHGTRARGCRKSDSPALPQVEMRKTLRALKNVHFKYEIVTSEQELN